MRMNQSIYLLFWNDASSLVTCAMHYDHNYQFFSLAQQPMYKIQNNMNSYNFANSMQTPDAVNTLVGVCS